MSLNLEVQTLQRVPMFANIEAARLKLLAFASERVSFPPGEILFHQGDDSDAAYVILKGRADVNLNTGDQQITVASIGDGSFVGEMGIISDTPRTATIEATEEIEALRITREVFINMIKEFPTMALEVMCELVSRIENTNAKLAAMSRKD
ncbi:Crp/Fnr family transcriptional regulator [Alphaproteobacteria bacterium]|nr:Crp/Fnr family transcriptional regulator [Alphaproteobacteria bacterium]